jgi:single-strand DNA-binding protein
MNQIILVGKSGKDAELKRSEKGTAYCFFSIATSEFLKEKNEYESTWHFVKMFGKTAEAQAPMIKKGTTVFVQGKIKKEKYKDKTGVDKENTVVMAGQVHVIQPKRDNYSVGQEEQGYPDAF